MKYLELHVRTAATVHGYNEDNWEITEEHQEETYVKKLIAIDRIQSISEDFVLVTSSHGRVMYWEYEENYDEIRARLHLSGLII